MFTWNFVELGAFNESFVKLSNNYNEASSLVEGIVCITFWNHIFNYICKDPS